MGMINEEILCFIHFSFSSLSLSFSGEDKNIDHLVFVVHGIGPFADIRLNSFRNLIECGKRRGEREEEERRDFEDGGITKILYVNCDIFL